MTGVVVAGLVVGSGLSAVTWVRTWPAAGRPSTPVSWAGASGRLARRRRAHRLGGRADVQLASGLGSPYEHLWSLPARTRDPRSERLAAVLDGPRAPTWFLAWAGLDAWDGTATARCPVLQVGTWSSEGLR